MDALTYYLTASLIAALFAAVVVAVLFRPLFGVVRDLCGTCERALFWSVYLSTILVLVPLLGVAFITTFGTRTPDLATFLERAVFFALLGLTGALVTIGLGIWRPTHRLAVEPPPAAPAPASDATAS